MRADGDEDTPRNDDSWAETDSWSEPVAPGDVRASDAERQHVVDQLAVAMSRGQLTPVEHSERVERALRARVRRDLDALIVDLSVQPPPYASSPATAASPGMVEPGGPSGVADPGTPVELRAMLGEVKRSGGWLVPRRLVLRGKGSSWELDFSATEIDHPVVDIELDVTGGSVELRLPPGASVSTENIDVRLSSVEDRRRDAVARGQPHLRVVGRMLFSSFEVRGPRRNWSWWSR